MNDATSPHVLALSDHPDPAGRLGALHEAIDHLVPRMIEHGTASPADMFPGAWGAYARHRQHALERVSWRELIGDELVDDGWADSERLDLAYGGESWPTTHHAPAEGNLESAPLPAVVGVLRTVESPDGVEVSWARSSRCPGTPRATSPRRAGRWRTCWP